LEKERQPRGEKAQQERSVLRVNGLKEPKKQEEEQPTDRHVGKRYPLWKETD